MEEINTFCYYYWHLYSTVILAAGENYQFDDSYKAYLIDKKYGNLSIKYEESIQTWMIHADFKKAGKTEVILESPEGEKTIFDITISRDKYILKEKNR